MTERKVWKRGVTVTPGAATAPTTQQDFAVGINSNVQEAVNRFVMQNAPPAVLEEEARARAAAVTATAAAPGEKPLLRHARQGVGATSKQQRDPRDLTKAQRMMARAAQTGGATLHQPQQRKKHKGKRQRESSDEEKDANRESKSGSFK